MFRNVPHGHSQKISVCEQMGVPVNKIRSRFSSVVSCCLMAAALAVVLMFSGCGSDGGAGEGWESVDQGAQWTVDARDAYWTQDQGTRSIPYSWLKSLQDGNGRPFLRDSLQRYGFMQMQGRELPVGFALGNDLSRVKQVGYTCSACHSREVVVGGDKYRIDGAPSLANFEQYTKELSAAFLATVGDAARFDAFLARVQSASRDLGDPTISDKAALKRQVLAWQQLNAQFYDATLPDPDMWGVGRLDALNQILSRVAGVLVSPDPNGLIVSNLHKANRPVRPPFLWDVKYQDRTQWTGSSANGNSDLALKRNYSEILGVGVELVAVADPSKESGFDWLANSTANWEGLKSLEELVANIGPPRWPWKVDAQLATRGKALYGNLCVSCHGITPGQARPPNLATWATPVMNVGTDPTYYSSLSRTGSSGILSGYLAPVVPLPVLSNAVSVLGLKQHQPSIALNYALPVSQTGSFESRVMRGIWAAAPYLHNGSVPTLDDLLKPAAQRPATFKVGTVYDVQKVGLSSTQPDRPGAIYSTSVEGNSNAGHEYGTTLSDQDRASLLEYLKTL